MLLQKMQMRFTKAMQFLIAPDIQNEKGLVDLFANLQ
jgi:hypothetical protein